MTRLPSPGRCGRFHDDKSPKPPVGHHTLAGRPNHTGPSRPTVRSPQPCRARLDSRDSCSSALRQCLQRSAGYPGQQTARSLGGNHKNPESRPQCKPHWGTAGHRKEAPPLRDAQYHACPALLPQFDTSDDSAMCHATRPVALTVTRGKQPRGEALFGHGPVAHDTVTPGCRAAHAAWPTRALSPHCPLQPVLQFNTKQGSRRPRNFSGAIECGRPVGPDGPPEPEGLIDTACSCEPPQPRPHARGHASPHAQASTSTHTDTRRACGGSRTCMALPSTAGGAVAGLKRAPTRWTTAPTKLPWQPPQHPQACPACASAPLDTHNRLLAQRLRRKRRTQ
jgi:hypothetical protein